MITVEEAHQIVMAHCPDFGTEIVDLSNALGRVLRQPLLADRPLPPFDRVTMDGIALDYEQYKQGQVDFKIQTVAAAGQPQVVLQIPTNCVEVMTGAMLPVGTDTVVRYEDLNINAGVAKVSVQDIKLGQNIHYQSQDRPQGGVIVPAGRLITPAELGVAASVGQATLQVAKQPRGVVISTGNELVAVNETPLPHQIRTSNSYALQAALQAHGAVAHTLHLPDDALVIEQALDQCLDTYDFIVFSGGVSAGKFDFVPTALNKLNVKKLFHKVAQRPGKPFWFGVSPAGKAVFALPGNPVSTFMCLHRYTLPWLRQALGCLPKPPFLATLAQNVSFMLPLTYFLQVKLQPDERGCFMATPVAGNGSGDLANLADADAFLELPQTNDFFEEGGVFAAYLYR